jgi:hypothetical protein
MTKQEAEAKIKDLFNKISNKKTWDASVDQYFNQIQELRKVQCDGKQKLSTKSRLKLRL